MTLEARLVYEVLLRQGPLDTIALRRAARLTSPDSTGRFNKAVDDLQMEFKILPVGIAETGAWRYAFIYDVTTHHMPEVQEQSRFIAEPEAQRFLLNQYYESVGASQLDRAARLFGWPPVQAQRAAQALVSAGVLVNGVSMAGVPGEWLAARQLVDP
jgi:uncharacterized protein YcaQ